MERCRRKRQGVLAHSAKIKDDPHPRLLDDRVAVLIYRKFQVVVAGQVESGR